MDDTVATVHAVSEPSSGLLSPSPAPEDGELHALRLHLLGDWLDALLPRRCAGCGGAVRGEGVFCPRCDGALPRIPASACVRCQERSAAGAGPRCSGCAGGGALEAAVAAVWLEDDVLRWMHAFKYPEPGLHRLDPRPAAAVRELAVRAARRVPGPPPELVAPIPLHPRRLRRRGFNPAGLIGRAVAEAAGARWDPAALLRLRDTPSQTGLDAPARRRNLRGALRARPALPARVWVVDDVITTGATSAEAARALRAAGAERVVALAPARTPRGRER